MDPPLPVGLYVDMMVDGVVVMKLENKVTIKVDRSKN